MEFIKIVKPGKRGRGSFERYEGVAYIRDGKVTIKLFRDGVKIRTVGIVNGGIGCVTVTSARKNIMGFCQTVRDFRGDLPSPLESNGYTFAIPAKRLSEDEYVFPYEDARMLNGKRRNGTDD